MIIKLFAIIVALSCIFIAGCGEDPENPCDLWVATAVVSGRVSDGDSGGAIVNTEIEVSIARSSECGGTEDWAGSQRVVTDEAGLYSVTLELGNQSGVRCVEAREVNTGAMARGNVKFVGGCDETGSPGKLTLDVTI